MTRILFINPLGTDIYDSHMQEVLERFKAPKTSVEVRSLTLPPEQSGPMLPAEPVYYNEIIGLVMQAEKEGFDAAVIGCAADPALPEAQRMAKIPVAGPLQAAAAFAAARGKKLAILYPDEHSWKHTISWATSNLRLYGLDHVVACIRFVDMHIGSEESLVAQVDVSLEDVIDRFSRVLKGPGLELAQKVLIEDAAEIVFFGCTIWGGLLEGISERLESPVLDALAVSLRMAELQAGPLS